VSLKVAMFCICGCLVGVGHYLLIGQVKLALLSGLLGGLGATAAVRIFNQSRP